MGDRRHPGTRLRRPARSSRRRRGSESTAKIRFAVDGRFRSWAWVSSSCSAGSATQRPSHTRWPCRRWPGRRSCCSTDRARPASGSRTGADAGFAPRSHCPPTGSPTADARVGRMTGHWPPTRPRPSTEWPSTSPPDLLVAGRRTLPPSRLRDDANGSSNSSNSSSSSSSNNSSDSNDSNGGPGEPGSPQAVPAKRGKGRPTHCGPAHSGHQCCASAMTSHRKATPAIVQSRVEPDGWGLWASGRMSAVAR